ncbi:hypothetical protein [Formosa sp. A9]|uniref:hypothetical protein n=1 Tax=Formosa sp. A9 TaxID=3442641 RepID=UPI003EB7E694
MNSNYFGIIKDPTFLDWDTAKQDNFLVKNSLFHYVITQNLNQIDFSDPELIKSNGSLKNSIQKLHATDSVLYEFVDFLKDHYKQVTQSLILNFEQNFKIEALAKSEQDKRQYACNYFKNTLKNITNEFNIWISDNIFDSLKARQDLLPFNFQEERELLLRFLTGESSYFTRNIKNKKVKKYLHFQEQLLFLVDLNKSFNFEKDKHFNRNLTVDLIYEDFESKVNHDVIKFIDMSIKTINDKIPSQIAALIDFLNKELNVLPVSEKIIRNTLNTHYSLNLKRINKRDVLNENHKKRVSKFRESWNSFPKNN